MRHPDAHRNEVHDVHGLGDLSVLHNGRFVEAIFFSTKGDQIHLPGIKSFNEGEAWAKMWNGKGTQEQFAEWIDKTARRQASPGTIRVSG